jgi:hypothetical protein
MVLWDLFSIHREQRVKDRAQEPGLSSCSFRLE